MKRICVKIGHRNNLKHIWAKDLSKLYYIKKRATPKLPKFVDDEFISESPSSPKILVTANQFAQ